jgi:peptidyl-prolyl cis-trans isomerase C
LGEISQGQLVRPIDNVVFNKPEHVVHGPVKSQFGFHLVEVKFRY